MKVLRLIDKHYEEIFIVVLFSWVIILIAIQVFTRYLSTSLNVPWTEEIARYSYIFMIFIGVSWCTRNDSHLKIDILQLLMLEEGVLTILSNYLIHPTDILYLKKLHVLQTETHVDKNRTVDDGRNVILLNMVVIPQIMNIWRMQKVILICLVQTLLFIISVKPSIVVKRLNMT